MYVFYVLGNYANRHSSRRNIWCLKVHIKRKNCSSLFHVVEQMHNQGETKYIHTHISYTCMHTHVSMCKCVCMHQWRDKRTVCFLVRVLYKWFQNYSIKNKFHHLPFHLFIQTFIINSKFDFNKSLIIRYVTTLWIINKFKKTCELKSGIN